MMRRARVLAFLLFCTPAFAQQPAVGTIEVFGLHRVDEAAVRRALAIHDGDPLPADKEDIERRVASLPGVRVAHLEGLCCVDGKYILWLGIEENGSPALRL